MQFSRKTGSAVPTRWSEEEIEIALEGEALFIKIQHDIDMHCCPLLCIVVAPMCADTPSIAFQTQHLVY